MKIAFFTQNYKRGGLDTFIVNLLSRWPTDDELLLFCNESHPGLTAIRSQLPHVRIIAYRFLLAHDVSALLEKQPALLRHAGRALYWGLGFFYLLYQTWALLCAHRPCRLMVINGSYPGGDACLAATISWKAIQPHNPAWHNLHSLVWPYPSGILSRRKQQVIDWLVSRAVAGFVAVSRACKHTLSNRPVFAQTASCHIYNGISDMQPKAVSALRTELDLPSSARIILMPAVFEPHKGHALAMQVMERVIVTCPDAYLLACGDSNPGELSRISQLRDASPARSHIILQPHRSDISSLLAQVDMVIMPSQIYESFGYAAVEAMACGLPVVATHVGGLPEVVEDGVTGYIVSPDDIDGFAARILELLGNNSLRNQMGASGRTRFQKEFMADRMAKEYARLLTSDNLHNKQKEGQ